MPLQPDRLLNLLSAPPMCGCKGVLKSSITATPVLQAEGDMHALLRPISSDLRLARIHSCTLKAVFAGRTSPPSSIIGWQRLFQTAPVRCELAHLGEQLQAIRVSVLRDSGLNEAQPLPSQKNFGQTNKMKIAR